MCAERWPTKARQPVSFVFSLRLFPVALYFLADTNLWLQVVITLNVQPRFSKNIIREIFRGRASQTRRHTYAKTQGDLSGGESPKVDPCELGSFQKRANQYIACLQQLYSYPKQAGRTFPEIQIYLLLSGCAKGGPREPKRGPRAAQRSPREAKRVKETQSGRKRSEVRTKWRLVVRRT